MKKTDRGSTMWTPWALAAVIAVAATGCQSVPHEGRRHRREKEAELQAQAKADSGVVKSDFKAKVAPDKEVAIHLDLARVYETQGYDDAAIAEYQKAIEVADGSGRRLGTSKAPGQSQAIAHRRMAQVM